LRLITTGEQALFDLEIKKKSRSSINLDIHHSKVFSSDFISAGVHAERGTKGTSPHQGKV